MARIIDSNEKNLIGSNLKILRKQKKMSQQELSDKLELLINNENICNILGQNGSCDMQLYKEENIMPKWDYLINNL